MKRRIEPSTAQDEELPYLVELLLNYPTQNAKGEEDVWDKEISYQMLYQNEPVEITLGSTMIKRLSKSAEARYEFIHDQKPHSTSLSAKVPSSEGTANVSHAHNPWIQFAPCKHTSDQPWKIPITNLSI